MTHDTSRRWQLLGIAAVIIFLIWLLAPVIMPFALAAMLAYLGDPLADRLQRLGMGRTLAVSIVFAVISIVFIGALLLLVPLIQHQVENLSENLPRYIEWVRGTALPWVQQRLHLDPDTFQTDKLVATVKEHIGSVGTVLAATVSKVTQSGMGVVMWMTNLVLIPVVAFYLLRDWDRMIEYIRRMLPRSIEPVVVHLSRESDLVLGAFVRGQLLVMLALGVFYGLGLTLVGISIGPLIGMIAGLLSFVPYLGFMIGFVAALIAALVQYGDWTHVLLVAGVFTVGQLLEGYVLVPRLVGGKIGLHPVAVIFAVLAGGHLFGFLGVLLALPAASVVVVLLRYVFARYQESELYTEPATDIPDEVEVDVDVDVTVTPHHVQKVDDAGP
ncbi:putative PurR-regulated permease PerM [Luteibacter sp. Sphag1AF]|uniref:AI-2E family transporter n=1 Tax=Luteibacter sp. Sphag1AF TaxID=2587031 RepID=UPI0016074327|nr:AI-2E family transporter [Luteibacter sp. Sphag1AF]MBB3225659.1 putative PurR-regulated permease PerM [Luteibacter sp. Sphag1AF]